MPGDVARQWFVPGDGIDRHVIVTDIQRYLGNDATVRPGRGTGENEGVGGYWIKAYRNLTTAMIADLRADSARWRQEQKIGPPTREYVGSNTYHNSVAARVPRSRDGDSPAVEAPYGSTVPGAARDRMPVDNRMPMDNRMPVDRMPTDRIPINRMPADRMPMDRMQDDRMQIDPPSGPPQGRYQTDRNGGYPPDPRYGADARGFPDARGPAYPPQDPSPYGRAPPVTSSYAQDSMYARSGPYPPQGSDGPPMGYVRQGNYYVPVSSADQPMRTEPSMYGGSHPYSQQPLQPQRMESRELRDPRDPRDSRDPRDPRYGQDYPQDPSPYGSAPSQYDPYGSQRPAQYTPSISGLPTQGNQRNGAQPARDPTYARERPAPPTSNDSARNTRRRI